MTQKTRSRRRSLKDSAGVTAIMFAGAAGALLVMIATAVELARISEARAKLAAAADATALAAKKKQIDDMPLGVSVSKTNGETAGQSSFTGNIGDLPGWAENPAITITWDEDLSARVHATADAKLMFGGILSLGGMLPFGTIPIRVTSVAGAGGDIFYEVAMVLDNTGSMFRKDGRPETRFTLMRGAARSFVNAAFDNQGAPDRLRISVVPWATTVNILSETPAGWSNAPFATGPVPDKGTQQAVSAPMNRAGYLSDSPGALASKFAPTTWRGCVSGAGESQTASDALKPAMQWTALAVPAWPHVTTWRPLIQINTTCTTCTSPPPSGPPPPPAPPSPPSPPPPPPPVDDMIGSREAPGREPARFAGLSIPTGARFGAQVVQAQTCTTVPCSYFDCDAAHPGVIAPLCWQESRKAYGSALGRRNTFTVADVTCINTSHNQCTQTVAPPTSTASACVSDPNEWAWNAAGKPVCADTPLSPWTTFDPTVGPNLNCPAPMLGLSGNRRQVVETINRMTPVAGGTHTDVGLRWGLRSLSPRSGWADFFGIGSAAPRPYGDTHVKKALVLITDGENTQAEDFPGFWGCSDTNAPGCSGAPDQAELDTRMQNWCEAIREDNDIELYTVAVNITNPTAVAALEACAGDPARAFSVDAGQLDRTLAEIAKSIFQLRLKE